MLLKRVNVMFQGEKGSKGDPGPMGLPVSISMWRHRLQWSSPL